MGFCSSAQWVRVPSRCTDYALPDTRSGVARQGRPVARGQEAGAGASAVVAAAGGGTEAGGAMAAITANTVTASTLVTQVAEDERVTVGEVVMVTAAITGAVRAGTGGH